jgi:hypothetical protein
LFEPRKARTTGLAGIKPMRVYLNNHSGKQGKIRKEKPLFFDAKTIVFLLFAHG